MNFLFYQKTGKNSLYFEDGVRKIDFILIYSDSPSKTDKFREFFEKNLEEDGLELEKQYVRHYYISLKSLKCSTFIFLACSFLKPNPHSCPILSLNYLPFPAHSGKPASAQFFIEILQTHFQMHPLLPTHYLTFSKTKLNTSEPNFHHLIYLIRFFFLLLHFQSWSIIFQPLLLKFWNLQAYFYFWKETMSSWCCSNFSFETMF